MKINLIERLEEAYRVCKRESLFNSALAIREASAALSTLKPEGEQMNAVTDEMVDAALEVWFKSDADHKIAPLMRKALEAAISIVVREKDDAIKLANLSKAILDDANTVIARQAEVLKSARQALEGVVSMDDEDGPEGEPSGTCQSVIAEIDAVLKEEWSQ